MPVRSIGPHAPAHRLQGWSGYFLMCLMSASFSLLKLFDQPDTAYLLKESFGQLWDNRREGRARRFFEQWRAALKWQRLKPYEEFAALIERHWDGIAAYCDPANKVSLVSSRD
jgi:hypothetical protein